MKMSDAFPSKWISAGDFQEDDNGNPVDMVLTIAEVKMESLEIPGQPSAEKPICYFDEIEKGLVLNKTNGKTIAALYGNDTDDWEGKRVALYATEVNFQGTMTPCVRVRGKTPKARPTLKPKSVVLTPANPGPMTTNEPDDADLPF